MPFVGLGLHFLVAICFAVHALRTGRNMYWLIILFSFPLLGSVVYFLVEVWPEMQQSRGIRQTGRVVRGLIDPTRELREAREALETAPTADNRRRYADALLAAGEAEAAVAQYRASLQGVHSNDPHLLEGLADAEFAAGQIPAARKTLEKLRALKNTFPTQESHLLYARVLAASGDDAPAREQFEQLVVYFNGPEAKCRYAEWLAQHGEAERARTLYQEVIKAARHWSSHAKSLQNQWLRQAQDGVR